MTTENDKSESKDKGEMRGALHCATDDETVRCFGRDDKVWGAIKNKQRQRRKADPYGMTNKKGKSNDETASCWTNRLPAGRIGFLLDETASCCTSS